MHYSQLAADRIAVAQQVVSLHLPSLDGARCTACGHAFPCMFRRAADGTLDAYGWLPQRVPGATLRAAGVRLGAHARLGPEGRRQNGRLRPAMAPGAHRADGRVETPADAGRGPRWPVNPRHLKPADTPDGSVAWRTRDDEHRDGARRGWFDAVVTPAVKPAVGVARVPGAPPGGSAGGSARRPRSVPTPRSGS
jgi:hypothetical protein